MKDFTVLIDMDDTIENLLDAWLDFLNNKHGTSVRPHDIVSWHIHDYFPSLTQDAVYEPLHLNDFWSSVSPKADAIKYVHKLYEDGFDLYICTSSCIDSVGAKVNKIIDRYFPYINKSNIIICNKKQMIIGDVLIDDAPHNLVGGVYKKILLTTYHNESFDACSNDVVRCADWKEIYEVIHHMYDAKFNNTFGGNNELQTECVREKEVIKNIQTN